MWQIWKEHYRAVFEKGDPSVPLVISKTKNAMSEFLLAVGDEEQRGAMESREHHNEIPDKWQPLE